MFCQVRKTDVSIDIAVLHARPQESVPGQIRCLLCEPRGVFGRQSASLSRGAVCIQGISHHTRRISDSAVSLHRTEHSQKTLNHDSQAKNPTRTLRCRHFSHPVERRGIPSQRLLAKSTTQFRCLLGGPRIQDAQYEYSMRK